MPTESSLAQFYREYEEGLPAKMLHAREASPQHALYSKFVERIAAFAPLRANATWLDVAAGTGVFTQLFAERFPQTRGIAIDFHSQPKTLSVSNVSWVCGDLNGTVLDEVEPVDVVAALAVLEHVRDVELFISKLVRLVKPEGMLYVMCPDAGSVMAKLMTAYWPYYLPGEHLNIPTLNGASNLLSAVLMREKRQVKKYEVRPITIPYTLAYVMAYVGLPCANAVARRLAIPVPAGAMEIKIVFA